MKKKLNKKIHRKQNKKYNIKMQTIKEKEEFSENVISIINNNKFLFEPDEVSINRESDYIIKSNIDDCCICLEKMDTNDNHIYKICNHKIHNKCYRKLNNRICPLCRTEEIIEKISEEKEIDEEETRQDINRINFTDRHYINIINYNLHFNSVYPENIIIPNNRFKCKKVCFVMTKLFFCFIIIGIFLFAIFVAIKV
jgi:hypothetical protein